jgi:hypothetical protein
MLLLFLITSYSTRRYHFCILLTTNLTNMSIPDYILLMSTSLFFMDAGLLFDETWPTRAVYSLQHLLLTFTLLEEIRASITAGTATLIPEADEDICDCLQNHNCMSGEHYLICRHLQWEVFSVTFTMFVSLTRSILLILLSPL